MDLHESDSDCEGRILGGSNALKDRAHDLWNHPARGIAGGESAAHGVRLAGPRLAVCEYGGIVAPEQALDQGRYASIVQLLRIAAVVVAEHVIVGEGLPAGDLQGNELGHMHVGRKIKLDSPCPANCLGGEAGGAGYRNSST